MPTPTPHRTAAQALFPDRTAHIAAGELVGRPQEGAAMASRQWRWVDELQEVLRDLEGKAHLRAIEQQVRARGRKPLGNNSTIRSTISSYLQYYSSDSKSYWGKGDFFHLTAKGTGVWELRTTSPLPLPEFPEEDFVEAGQKLRLHRVKERCRKAVRRKKGIVIRETGKLVCEACDFDFLRCYGPLGEGFAECHHRTPLAELEEGHKTRLADLAIVCANCHRMLHRSKPMRTVEALRELVLAQRVNCSGAEPEGGA